MRGGQPIGSPRQASLAFVVVLLRFGNTTTSYILRLTFDNSAYRFFLLLQISLRATVTLQQRHKLLQQTRFYMSLLHPITTPVLTREYSHTPPINATRKRSAVLQAIDAIVLSQFCIVLARRLNFDIFFLPPTTMTSYGDNCRIHYELP